MPPRKKNDTTKSNTKLTAMQLRDAVNETFGAGTVSMGDDPKFIVSYLPTNLLPMDIIFSGGLPRGRSVEIFGGPSMLKSFIAYKAIAQTQQDGGTAALLDTEHAYDPLWVANCGVDTKSLIAEWPVSGEMGIDFAEVVIRGNIDLLVVDSIASLLPEAEKGKRLHNESVQPGRLAALMSVGLRKLTTANSHTALMFTNQIREQIGITFGPTEKTPGGRAMSFYASIRLNIRSAGKNQIPIKVHDGDKLVDSKEVIGQKYRMTLEKSKLSTPHREVLFEWDLRTGAIDIPKFIFSQGVELGMIGQSGNSWIFSNTKVLGRENFITTIANTPSLAYELECDIRNHYKLPILEQPKIIKPTKALVEAAPALTPKPLKKLP